MAFWKVLGIIAKSSFIRELISFGGTLNDSVDNLLGNYLIEARNITENINDGCEVISVIRSFIKTAKQMLSLCLEFVQ